MSARVIDLVARIGLSAALVVSGYVHADLYSNGYRYIHMIGPSFLIQASASFAIAALLLIGGPWTLRVVAALLAAGALVAFELSRTIGIFGFTERGWQPSPQAAWSVAAEIATLLFCVVSLAPLVHRRRMRRSIARPTG